MSVEQPDALALLEIARQTLLEQVVPELAGDARYQALMVANAMAMAMRELRPTVRDSKAATRSLRELYRRLGAPDGSDGDGPDGPQTDLGSADVEVRFARDLRNGVFDGEAQQQVRKLLRARLEARLAVSNPRRVEPVAE